MSAILLYSFLSSPIFYTIFTLDAISYKVKKKLLHCATVSSAIWYPRPESNRQRCFRRALLYPFNYGDMYELVNTWPCVFILPLPLLFFNGEACRLLSLRKSATIGAFFVFVLRLKKIPQSYPKFQSSYCAQNTLRPRMRPC